MTKRLSFLLMVFLLTVMASHFHPVGASEDSVAKVTLVSGEPVVKQALSGDWSFVEIGMALYPQDEIKTDENSFLEIQYEDGSILRLDSQTELSIEGGGKKQFLNLLTGKIYNRIKRLYSKDSSYEVMTPTGIAGVRGTEFKVEHRFKETRVAVLDGVVEAENEEGKILLSKNTHSFLKAKKRPAPPLKFDPTKEISWEKRANPLIKEKIKLLGENLQEYLSKREHYRQEKKKLYATGDSLLEQQEKIRENLNELEGYVHNKNHEELRDEINGIVEKEEKLRKGLIDLKRRVRNFSQREEKLIALESEIAEANSKIKEDLNLFFNSRSFDPDWSRQYLSSYKEMVSKMKELKEEDPLEEIRKELHFNLKELEEKRNCLSLTLWRLKERAGPFVEKEKGFEVIETLLDKEEGLLVRQREIKKAILDLFSPEDIDSLWTNTDEMKLKYEQAEELVGQSEKLMVQMEKALGKAELRADKRIRYRREIGSFLDKTWDFKEEIGEEKKGLEELKRLSSRLLKTRDLIPESMKDYEKDLEGLFVEMEEFNPERVKKEISKIKEVKKKGLGDSELREKNDYLNDLVLRVRFLWNRAKRVAEERRDLLGLLDEVKELTHKTGDLIKSRGGSAIRIENNLRETEQETEKKLSALRNKEKVLRKTIINLKSNIKNVREEV